MGTEAVVQQVKKKNSCNVRIPYSQQFKSQMLHFCSSFLQMTQGAQVLVPFPLHWDVNDAPALV